MSDAYYQERAARRTRSLLIAGGLLLVAGCLAAAVLSLFYDACTRSLDRSAEAIVRTYAEAVSRGDAAVAQECWQHEAYYDLDTGCSEICLSRVLGVPFHVAELSMGTSEDTPDGRSHLVATVSAVCTESGLGYTSTILLDSVSGNWPWRHWSIIESGLGGTVAEPWCK